VIAPNSVAAWGDKPPAASVRASNLEIIGKSTLKATVDLTVPKWCLVIHGALWCEKGVREWIAFPAPEWTDRNGIRKFANIIEFTDRDTASRSQRATLAAMHAIAGTS
jgi:hypothetical protein